MKNPVKKNMDKYTRPSTHIDKKKEAKKHGFSEDDISTTKEFLDALPNGIKFIESVRIFEDLPNVWREGQRDD